eukprot:3774013-Pyramimonas_sp.AAC.1
MACVGVRNRLCGVAPPRAAWGGTGVSLSEPYGADAVRKTAWRRASCEAWHGSAFRSLCYRRGPVGELFAIAACSM